MLVAALRETRLRSDYGIADALMFEYGSIGDVKIHLPRRSARRDLRSVELPSRTDYGGAMEGHGTATKVTIRVT
jgi:hypothetical protein